MATRRSLGSGLVLALAATLVTVSAFLPWDKVSDLPSHRGFSVRGTALFTDVHGWSALRWDGFSPSVGLRVLMTLAAWGLVALVRARRRARTLLAIPVALGVAFVLGVGDPAPSPWGTALSGLRVVPSLGYWLAVSGLVLVLVGATVPARAAG